MAEEGAGFGVFADDALDDAPWRTEGFEQIRERMEAMLTEEGRTKAVALRELYRCD